MRIDDPPKFLDGRYFLAALIASSQWLSKLGFGVLLEAFGSAVPAPLQMNHRADITGCAGEERDLFIQILVREDLGFNRC